MSMKSMQILSKQGFLGKAYVTSLDFCQTCILGKQHMLSFPKETHMAKACLDYMHADLLGPTEVSTFGGNIYFLFLIDDYSRIVEFIY